MNTPTKQSARDKVKTLSELGHIADEVRAQGKTIALAHGAFDLLHLGHVRHLERARKEADILVVTLTADAHVNKGPGRPVFTQELRAEMLAALEYVSWVAINDEPSAINAIDAVKPSAYIKGSDYANAEDDVTGKIKAEQDAVEAHGGQLVFTDEVTFSSSELINRHLDVHDPEVRGFLDDIRQGIGLDGLLDIVDRVQDMRVLIIGDTILDEYQYVRPSGQPSKEHIIATRYRDDELFAGGIIAAANHVAGFCREVEVLTCLGAADSREDFVRNALKPNVKLNAIYRADVPTTRKLRFVDTGYLRKMFEVHYMDDEPLSAPDQTDLEARIAELAPQYDLVIVADFGHGLINNGTVETIEKHARFLAVNAQTNSANRGYNLITKYPRADYVCIDAPEAQLAVGDRFSDLEIIAQDLLPARVDCDHIILTHGRHGCVTWEKDETGEEKTTRIPAITKQVVDTMGAGDAFLAATAPMVAAGAPIAHVGLIGNIVGALKVGIVGHRAAIDRVGVIKALTALLK